MNLPVFRPKAAADIEDAYTWYENQRSGLGEEFLEELELAVTALAANPHRFAVIHRNTRRALLHRFPYGVFYRVADSRILVIACLHASRDPSRWRVR